ncbi:MAG: ABC transporter permease [Blautia sp.]
MYFAVCLVSQPAARKKNGKNDLKSRFAGSYFGTVWAFIQPIVTILVYYFVFGIAMRGGAASGDGTPFVLYLVSGIVPWMYFQEGLVNGTNAFLEYSSYLVKKVVFDISVLPVVKLLSALVIHLFFVAFAMILFALLWVLSGHLLSGNPLLYDLSFPFDPGHRLHDELCYRLLFRDMGQIVSILLQIGVWLTPVMWDLSFLNGYSWGSTVMRILKLNPFYYIVHGYRNAFIEQRWFWEDKLLTIYFWAFLIVCYVFSTWVFNRLKGHFADVL